MYWDAPLHFKPIDIGMAVHGTTSIQAEQIAVQAAELARSRNGRQWNEHAQS